jgi:hypothetical protein
LEWAKGVGLSMGAFGLASVALGAIMLTGVGAVALIAGIAAMAGIAEGLVLVSGILSTGTYTGGPTEEWAKGVGMALTSFTDAVSALSPSGWDLIGGNTMQDKINALVQVGAALPLLANVIAGGNYTGGPSAEWGVGVGASVSGFANAIASMADLDLSTIPTLMLALMPVAQLMKYFATQLSGTTFSSYPSPEWIDGITKFMDGFSELDMVDNAADAAKQIMMLSRSYISLAGSIGLLGKSLQTVKTAPDLTGIYGGLVTLSLIDSDNLESTLTTLNDKKDEFQSVLSMIQAQSSVKIDENTFAFNKDKSEAKSNNATNNQASVKTTSSAPATVKAQPKPATASDNKPDKQEKLLNQLVQLMGQMNGVLGEIADNTSQKIHESSVISN